MASTKIPNRFAPPLLGLLALASIILSGCQTRAPDLDGGIPAVSDASEVGIETPPPTTAGPSRWPPDGTAEGHVGVLVARRTLDVSAELEGRLESVEVEVGDRLAVGDVIATIDTSETEQELASARAALAAAQAATARARVELRRITADLERRRDLAEVFSREEIESLAAAEETAQATVESEEARVDQEEARIAQLKTRLTRSELRSPIAGRVALRRVEKGELVRPGTQVIRLVSSGDFVVRFAIPPERSEQLPIGQSVRVLVTTPNLELTGRVSEMAPQIDLASQMLFARADLEIPGDLRDQLQDGLMVRVFENPPPSSRPTNQVTGP